MISNHPKSTDIRFLQSLNPQSSPVYNDIKQNPQLYSAVQSLDNGNEYKLEDQLKKLQGEKQKPNRFSGMLPKANTAGEAPVKPTEENARIQRLQKFNMLGQALGSVFDLGTIATGGAVAPRDNAFNQLSVERLGQLDDRYWTEMQQYRDRMIWDDRYNLEAQGKENMAQVQYDIGQEQTAEAQKFRSDEAKLDRQAREDQRKVDHEFRMKEIDKRTSNAIYQAKQISETTGTMSPEDFEAAQYIFQEYNGIMKDIEEMENSGDFVDPEAIKSMKNRADDLKESIPPQMFSRQLGQSLKEKEENEVFSERSVNLKNLVEQGKPEDLKVLGEMVGNPNHPNWDAYTSPRLKKMMYDLLKQELYNRTQANNQDSQREASGGGGGGGF